jgi:molybdopterin converting factor small subunit
MDTVNTVTVNVSLSGWLSSYFDEKTLTVTTTQWLADALPDIIRQVVSRARSPIPKGGMSVLVNGTRTQGLVQQGYLLRDGDEITLVPVVAGG